MVKYDLKILRKGAHVREVFDVEEETLPRIDNHYVLIEEGIERNYTVKDVTHRAILGTGDKLEVITEPPLVLIQDISFE